MSMDEDPIWYGGISRHVSRSDIAAFQKSMNLLHVAMKQLENRIEVLERTMNGILHSDNPNGGSP